MNYILNNLVEGWGGGLMVKNFCCLRMSILVWIFMKKLGIVVRICDFRVVEDGDWGGE